MPDDPASPSASPGSTPTGYQRTQGGGVKWQPPTAEHLAKLLPQYEVEALVGRGGMGAVYKGRQKSLDRPVAIKILPPEVDDEDGSYTERFKNEAKVMAKFTHPAIVAVHDFGETSEGQLFFIMEFVNGTDVNQMIEAQGRLPPQHALAITAHVCDALKYAHEHGVIHRDIKPSNVLINMEGAVKVADFGLAKMDEAGAVGFTKQGVAMGTPDFVAPEALVMGVNVDGRADIYAVGVMLYNMLTGNVPRGAFKPASALVPGLDPRYDAIATKAMQHEREDRYQSAAEMRRDLDVILRTPQVKSGGPSSSAIPKQQVKPGNAGLRPAPGGPQARAPRKEAAPAAMPHPKSKAPLFIGIGAAAVIAAGAFFMLGGRKDAKQSGPLSPLSGSDGVSASDSAQRTVRTTPPPAAAPIKVREEPKPAPVIVSSPPKPGAPAPAPEKKEEPQPVAAAPTTPSPVATAAPATPVVMAEAKPAAPPPPAASATPANPGPQPVVAAAPAAPAEPAKPDPNDPIAQRLAQIETQFQAAFQRDAGRSFTDAVAKLNTGYSSALDRTLDAASKAGTLEEAVTLREEKARMADGRGLPPADLDSLPAALKQLRLTYRTAHAKLEAERDQKAAPLYDRYDQTLTAYQTELTTQKKLDDALKVKAKREEIAARNSKPMPTEPAVASKPAGKTPPPIGAKPSTTAESKLTSLIRGDMSPLPESLQQARLKGGRLRFWGTSDGKPLPISDSKFKQQDFIAVTITPDQPATMYAVRKNGDGVMVSFGNGNTGEMKDVHLLSRGYGTAWLDVKGKVRGGPTLGCCLTQASPRLVTTAECIGVKSSSPPKANGSHLPQLLRCPMCLASCLRHGSMDFANWPPPPP